MTLRSLFLKAIAQLLCLIASLGLFWSTGSAQESITLDRCLALAIKNNPKIRLADNALRSARLLLSELETTRLPQVAGVAAATYAPVPPTFGYDPAISNGGQVAGQIVIHQSLYDAGIRGLKSDQLQLDVERVAHERDLAQLDLTLAVKQSFTDALRAQEEVDLKQQSIVQLLGYADLVNRLYKGGTANYTDVLKTEMQITAARLELESARESSVAAQLTLMDLIGTPIDSTTRISGSFEDIQDSTTDASVVHREPDLVDNIEMSIAGLMVEKSQLDIQMTNHERLPDLSLIADAGYVSSGENLRLPERSRLNTMGYSIGIGLEIPILNWGATGLRVQERELAADDFRLHMEVLRKSLSTEIRKAYLQLSTARARLRALREKILKAEQNFVLTKAKYAAGAALSLEVLTAQQLQTDTNMDELQTRADIQLLLARLERLTARTQTHARR